jgi:hypothetical protein
MAWLTRATWKSALVFVLAFGTVLVSSGASSAAVIPPYQWTATASSAVGDTVGSVDTSDVVCPSVGWCVAVGVGLGASGGNLQTLSNGSWTSQNASPGTDNILNSVACPSVGSCVAVGTSDNEGSGVIETLSGGTWTGMTAPLIGLNPAPAPYPDVILDQVSCPTETFCTAVGQYEDTTYGNEGLIETLSGGTWQATTAPLSGLTPAPELPVSSGNPVDLDSVSCPSAGSCFAVGSYYDTTGDNVFGLIETLNGGDWIASTAPSSGLNPASGANPAVTFAQLDCSTVTSCVAVGSYDDSSSNVYGLIESFSDGTWTATTAPLGGLSPAAASNPKVGFGSLDCVSSSWCVAVGSYTDAAGGFDGLIETLSGGAWESSTVPTAGLWPPAAGGYPALFPRISCDSVGSCVAVGGNVIETLSDGSWSPLTAPGVNDPTGAGVDLQAVSCPAAGSCISLGTQAVGQGYYGLIDTQSLGPPPTASGYWEVASDGGLFSFNAPFYGSTGGMPLNAPIVGVAEDPCTGGYWEVASDGGIFAFNAPFNGSVGGKPLNAPIVGIAAYIGNTTCGYWEVASDGGIFAFNAPYDGSMGGRPLAKPVVGIAADYSTGGYWEVASDGGLFSFNAPFYGSMGGHPLVRPVVGMASDPSTGGYWEVASDGGLFSFNAPFYGSMGG